MKSKVYIGMGIHKRSVMIVAVARELAGFVWALMQEGVAEIETQRRAA